MQLTVLLNKKGFTPLEKADNEAESGSAGTRNGMTTTSLSCWLVQHPSGKDSRQAGMTEGGFTLIEVMIAMVVSLLVFFALMQTALVSIDSNMKNNLRDEAANIAAMRMEQARNLRYTLSTDNLISDAVGTLPAVDLSGNTSCPATPAPFAAGVLEPRNIRSITANFCTNRTVTAIDSNTKRVTIRVGWKWRNEDFNHNISTIVRIQSG